MKLRNLLVFEIDKWYIFGAVDLPGMQGLDGP
jgi:hypothetical protein